MVASSTFSELSVVLSIVLLSTCMAREKLLLGYWFSVTAPANCLQMYHILITHTSAKQPRHVSQRD